ncbi:MAG: hypothetical protein ACYC3X_07455 [Pirellulaceae bacterium]
MNLYLIRLTDSFLTSVDSDGRPILLVYATDEDATEAAEQYGGEVQRVVL